MNTNKDILPTFYNRSFDQKSPIWVKETNWSLDSDLGELLFWIQLELSEVQKSVDSLQESAKCLLKDLVKLVDIRSKDKEIIQFFQFYISACVLEFITGMKMLHYSYDWLCNSVSYEINDSIEREYKPLRLADYFVSKNTFIKDNFAQIFLKWSDNLFYYSRCTGGHNELCEIYLKTYFNYLDELIEQNNFNMEMVGALSQISTWCIKHDKIKYNEKANKILYLIYQTETNEAIKKNIAFQFTCLKTNSTQISRKKWCDIVENKYSEMLVAHEHLHLFLNRYEYDEKLAISNLDLLYKNIDLYHAYLSERFKNNILLKYELARIYSLFTNLFHTLLIRGKIFEVNSIIGYYFKIDKEILINDKILYIIPNTASGVAYCTVSMIQYTDTNTLENIPQIINISNKFFSTTNTLDDDLTFKYDLPLRPGHPDAAYADDLYKALKNHFKFENLLHIPNVKQMNGIHLFYAIQFPLQSIISKEHNFLLPIIQSFEKPDEERVVKKVFFWQGETTLGEMELKALSNLFLQKGIECSFVKCENSSKEDFLLKYKDESYDLIWICCHGEFNHHEPHKSYLNLGNGISVDIEELSVLKLPRRGRRLLMIDACDGATTSLVNSPASIGIGASIVNAKQSVISHQWPIDNYSALISGVLFGIFLSQGKSYADALNEKINIFSSGKEKVLEFVKANCNDAELIERISNTEINFQNFYSWGSLVYFI